MSKVSLVVTLGSALACHTASAQTRGPNLLEQARTRGNVTVTAQSCGFVGGPPTLNGLTHSADIIFHGTVVAADGRLSDDLYEVWTDYHIEPLDVLRSHPLAESGVPTFAVRGGVVFVEGREIAYHYRQSGQRLSMTVGEEVVVLGALRDNGERFHVTGVFHVVAGRATSEGRLDGFDRMAGEPLEQLLKSIREVVAHSQR
jgi:hypothetical protein